MAANTRYEPAPQRDSFEDRPEDRPYTQPPPSYQAAGEMPGTPRSEEDNLPDDFKVSLSREYAGEMLMRPTVRWHSSGGDASYPDAVHPQGIRDLVSIPPSPSNQSAF